MFGRVSSPAGKTWICYVCAFTGMHVIEGRQLFTVQLTADLDTEAGGKAEVFGDFGGFFTGVFDATNRDTELNIGGHGYTINDCTKDFLKITSNKDRTAYLFVAQQSRSFTPF